MKNSTQFRNSFLTILLCLGGLGMNAQNYTWTKKADLPDPNYQGSSFTIGSKVYVTGGVIAHAQIPVTMNRHVWQYDPTTNAWTQMNDAPGTAVYGASSFVIGGYAYIVNGWDSTTSSSGPADCWRYDPGTDTWASMAPFPGSTRYTCAAFALNGLGYVGLGFSPFVNDLWQYDPVANSWTQKASFPGTPRQNPTSFTIGNYAYVGMGAPAGYFGWEYFASDFYRYDPSSDTWTQLNDFPGQPIAGNSTFVMDSAAYLVCTLNESQYNFADGASKDIWKYDPSVDNWSYWGVFPDTGIWGGNHVTCNGLGYVGQGEHYVFGTYSRVWWSFGQAAGPYSCAATIAEFPINNATYNFQASGSFSPYAQLSWNFGDGHTGTGTNVIHSYSATGTYGVTLTVTDTSGSTCTATANDSVTISNLSNCSVTVGSVNIGGQYTLYANVSGDGPYTYSWSSPQDSLFSSSSPDPLVTIPADSTVTYCVTITDTTGCSASACTAITYIPSTDSCQTSLYIFPDGDIPGLYYAYVYHTGAPIVSYSWSFGDGGTSPDSLPDYVYGSPGYFIICLTTTDSSGCVSGFCDSFFYAFKTGGGPIHELDVKPSYPLGIRSPGGQMRVTVYPNPANTELVISPAGQKVDKAIVYDINGQKVSETSQPLHNTIDVGTLADGIYFLEVTVSGQVERVKFVKAN